MSRRAGFLGLLMIAMLVSSGNLRAEDEGEKTSASRQLYVQRIKPLLKTKCYSCHAAIKQESGLRLDTGRLILRGGDSGPAINTGKAEKSLILERVASSDASERMPPEAEPLTKEQVRLLSEWIRSGAHAPKHEMAQLDPSKHWSYQTPKAGQPFGPGHLIDRYVDRRLKKSNIRPVGPATPEVLVRRLFLDLHGLPPTIEELHRWSASLRNKEWKKGAAVDQQALKVLVDHLLASPRYGERWAQHWLDVVRYADTHGFEVNTPRPNAWPYRDYVIQALNSDKPYDRFVFEQLAGDSVGENRATGFLVAAAVLLPGQIGADDASKRLARQDSLDEIIVGTSATFLGLTVGCARCHDHKFDPISQRDYYAMQAFFAGVEYGEREVGDAEQGKKKAEAAKLGQRITELTNELRRFEPVSYTGRMVVIDDEDLDRVTLLKTKTGHGTNPDGKQRGYGQDTGDSLRLANISGRRYTWWANKADQDLFTWNPGLSGRFRLWISWGAHGSGVHTRDARYLLDRDGDLTTRGDQSEIAKVDQYYFSGISTGTTEKKPLWSGLLDVGEHDLTAKTRLILRGGKTGTGITADVIVLQEVVPGEGAEGGLTPGADTKSPSPTSQLPKLRDPVQFSHNIERFAPVDARFVRFTTFETTNKNRYEPCLDELEVFRAGEGLNVARDSHGTRPTSSGNLSETGIHQIKHVNDGKYGNSNSWISNKKGGGWIQLEFANVEKIDRVEWGRDRNGQFRDRLPVRYRIDVSIDGQRWTSVAQSNDRARQGTPTDRIKTLLRGANRNADQNLSKSISDLEKLQRKKAKLERPQMVFAGKFRSPDVTRLLNRGDPEQPLENVTARVPSIFGKVAIDKEEDEQQRRIALAKWITSKANPLTARVMVNRVWQSHFGKGLVDTPSDLGVNGTKPTHPELLDALAIEWMNKGWSVKGLHRLILTSAAYQRSSQVDLRAQKLDADSRLLWRFPSRRLEAEAIRDSILYISGQLNLEMGGPGFDFFKSRGGLSGFPPLERFGRAQLRRMVYAHKIRMERVPVFGAFDCPDAGQPTPKRSQSTTPIQALNLFNSEFVLEQANALASLAAQRSPDSIEQQVDFVFRSALGRPPEGKERAASVAAARKHGLTVVCRVLFNSNEFLFLP